MNCGTYAASCLLPIKVTNKRCFLTAVRPMKLYLHVFPQFRHGRCGSSSKATQRSLIGTNRGCKLQTRCQSSIRSNGDPGGYHEGGTYMTTARWWPRLGETALFKAVLPYCWLPRRRWPKWLDRKRDTVGGSAMAWNLIHIRRWIGIQACMGTELTPSSVLDVRHEVHNVLPDLVSVPPTHDCCHHRDHIVDIVVSITVVLLPMVFAKCCPSACIVVIHQEGYHFIGRFLAQ